LKIALPWATDLDVMHHNNGLGSYNYCFRVTKRHVNYLLRVWTSIVRAEYAHRQGVVRYFNEEGFTADDTNWHGL